MSRKSGLPMHAPLFGIEFVRRFQFILADETHKWKHDALVETQTPNPLFRESSDVLRLNDIWYGSRNVPQMMRVRARISKIAGWPLVDCDNASSTTLSEWWSYMLQQPSIGIPALYFVTRTESTKEIGAGDRCGSSCRCCGPSTWSVSAAGFSRSGGAMNLYGVYRGTVGANNDPSGRGRVKVSVPTAGSRFGVGAGLPSGRGGHRVDSCRRDRGGRLRRGRSGLPDRVGAAAE